MQREGGLASRCIPLPPLPCTGSSDQFAKGSRSLAPRKSSPPTSQEAGRVCLVPRKALSLFTGHSKLLAKGGGSLTPHKVSLSTSWDCVRPRHPVQVASSGLQTVVGASHHAR